MKSVHAGARAGITVSCDLNYRKNLWKWGKPAHEVMRELVKYCDVVIANEEDCQAALGIEADVDVHAGTLDEKAYRALAEKVVKAYPNVKTIAIDVTLEDAESGEVIEIDTGNAAIRRRFSEEASKRVQRLISDIRSEGVDTLELRTDAPYLPALQRFFKSRERKRI